ncbi:MAG: (2Fe-2S)-binding protein [Thiohalophilus sp.]|jgi:isoquinoline 1-oxidoreductase alpha subunit
MITLSVNGEAYTLDIEPDMPLLWALRDVMQLTGTKYGCGIAMCGACTVHVDGAAVQACVTPVSSVEGKQITTIEKVSSPAARAVQDAWLKHEVVQCGYCQSGQIMSAIALLEKNPAPDDDAINEAMRYNLCRCHTYTRIRAAIHDAAQMLAANGGAA